MVTIKKALYWLVPFVTVLCMSSVESADWKDAEQVCFHEDHHGSVGYYMDVDFDGCKAACEAENMKPASVKKYTCRSVFYDAELEECWGDADIKGCYDSTRWQIGDCKTHQTENGYKNMKFAEIVRESHGGCKENQFECPCTINGYGEDGGSGQHGGHPRCQSGSAVCDGSGDCWGRNNDDELLSNCPQEVTNQAEEGNADCINAENGGADYRGNISVSAKGDKCMDWFEAEDWLKETYIDKPATTFQDYLNHQNFKGEHNFCRNTLWGWHAVKLKPSPVCYVKSVGKPVEVPCSIPTCKEPKKFDFSGTLGYYYKESKEAIIENSGSSYNYFIQTEGCELSLDDWWKNIADCKKFNPHDVMGLCPYGVCEQDSDWHKCIKDSCKLPKITKIIDVVGLIRTRYETCSVCSSHCSAKRIQDCVACETKEDLATPNGKWAQCINEMFKPMSRCGIPKYWSFPNIEDEMHCNED